jgi:sensor c-di-GMP phosphodiesterase-like protein
MANPTPFPQDYRAVPEVVEEPEHTWTSLTEEQASQGFKTGHMRWVLAIGFALAGITLAAVAILS